MIEIVGVEKMERPVGKANSAPERIKIVSLGDARMISENYSGSDVGARRY